jgi:cell division septal protein FtsQ
MDCEEDLVMMTTKRKKKNKNKKKKKKKGKSEQNGEGDEEEERKKRWLIRKRSIRLIAVLFLLLGCLAQIDTLRHWLGSGGESG